MKKITLLTIVAIASIIITNAYGISVTNASGSSAVCRVAGKITKVTDASISFTITSVSNQTDSSGLCTDKKAGDQYEIANSNIFKNSFKSSFVVGKIIVIDGTSYSAMGPDGVVNGNGWTVDSAGGNTVNVPIGNASSLKKIASASSTKSVTASVIATSTSTRTSATSTVSARTNIQPTTELVATSTDVSVSTPAKQSFFSWLMQAIRNLF